MRLNERLRRLDRRVLGDPHSSAPVAGSGQHWTPEQAQSPWSSGDIDRGWHPDPWYAEQLRWCDGKNWTGDVAAESAIRVHNGPVQPPLGEFGRWLVSSRLSRVVSPVATAFSMVCTASALVLTLADWIRHRPVTHGGALLLALILPVFFGQLWAVAWLVVRRGPRVGWTWRRRGVPVSAAFGPVNQVLAIALGGLIVFAGIAAATTDYSKSTETSTHRCPHRVSVDKNPPQCVSAQTYDRVAADEQRSEAGIVLFFSAFHLLSSIGAISTQHDAKRFIARGGQLEVWRTGSRVSASGTVPR